MRTDTSNIVIRNRRASHDYEFLEKLIAGIKLTGTEIKSIRAGKATLTDSFCAFRGGELFVTGMHMMDRYGLTQEHFAKIAVKSHKNGALNPHSQYQEEVTLEQVLNSGDVSWPLTRMMCSPIGDGAAAVIVCSKEAAARFGARPVWIASSVVGSGKLTGGLEDTLTKRLAPKRRDGGDAQR